MPVLAVDLQRVSSPQRQQAVRKLFTGRHLRPVEQHRKEPYAAAQPSLDFKPNEVIGIVDPSLSGPVPRVQPFPADDDDEGVAAGYPLLDNSREVVARSDIVDVDKDPIGPEAFPQRVREAVSRVRRVVTAVADEDPASGTRSRRLSLTVQTRFFQWRFPPEPQLLCHAPRPIVGLYENTDIVNIDRRVEAMLVNAERDGWERFGRSAPAAAIGQPPGLHPSRARRHAGRRETARKGA